MIDGMRDQLRQAAAEMDRLEYVLKDPAEIDPRDLIGKNGHRPKPEIQRTNIVEPENMVDMAMRDQNGIQITDVCPQGLLTEIGRGIDEDRLTVLFDQYGNS